MEITPKLLFEAMMNVTNIDKLELDLKVFPHKIKAFVGEFLFREWTFKTEKEAKNAQSDIWSEIFRTKIGGIK